MRHVPRTVSLLALSLLAGCASLGTHTEGKSGSIAWRVTNIVSASRPIEGKPVEGQAFTVVLKNVGDEIITFTEYEKILYRPRTNPGVSRSSGKWTLRPDAEWRLELFSGLVCRYGGGCNSSGGTQALIRIVLTGNDAKERPVRTQLDITLPPADIAQKPPIIR